MQEVYLNDKLLETYHCKMLEPFTEVRDKYSGNYLQPALVQMVIPLTSEIPVKSVSFALSFFGDNTDLWRGNLERTLMSGTVELKMPGRNPFTLYLNKIGTQTNDSTGMDVQYSFIGYQHGKRVTNTIAQSDLVSTLDLQCTSTAPKTPCKISLSDWYFGNHSNYDCAVLSVNKIMFDVSKEYIDYLTKVSKINLPHSVLIDSENQTFEVDGENVLSAVASADFPLLIPGNNNLVHYNREAEVHNTGEILFNVSVEHTPIFL